MNVSLKKFIVAVSPLSLIKAAGVFAADISVEIPHPFGAADFGTSSVGYVANFYQFALMASGLLAFGAIMYGAIKYAVSAGNPSQQSDAKQWIIQALVGLLLLAGAVLILRTLNPDAFAEISLPQLTDSWIESVLGI